ncbi:MAG TPA: protein-methionine-sulfoxide reductase catalytic subunit MsrP [Anaerolineaceae bacterium]|nr:protein-methionine-sulfoxide reductase catalytic subunit MsrP [Anaerolineaceae bacterium]
MKIPLIPSSEITPKQAYLSRRDFMKAAGVVAGSVALVACAVPAGKTPPSATKIDSQAPSAEDVLNSFDEITNYNNYYEFTTDKQGVASLSKDFVTSPWDVEISGMVNNPGKFSVDDLTKKYPLEERIYRLRCVEAWSMVIPWLGFPLAKLLNDVEPTSSAKYVRFETIYKPDDMPGQKQSTYPWPYQEGLRIDEAMNDLTLLATGLYGGELPAQSGGGIRLVVPWKYGFKSIKAIVKIELTDQQPATMWSTIAPNEYGFYANVNPFVDHPRWSQASERRIGEFNRRDTIMFNGYSDQVSYLYDGMDLKKNY